MDDIHTIWQHRWITHKAKAKKSSIHGLGVVATEPISKGEVVGILGGVIVHVSEITKYREKLGHVGIQIDDDFFAHVPYSISSISRRKSGVFNHSCEPNIGYENAIKFVAIKDIKPGEELLFDYAFSETFFEPFECKCSSVNCRKIIKPDDWKMPEIQKKYGKYFSPYLKKNF